MGKLIKIFSVLLIMIFIISATRSQVSAYSYGDPGKEQFAEAYREVQTYVAKDDWESVKKVYESYNKEFTLYFKKTMPYIEQAIEEKNVDLLHTSYQAALRLNIERRLHFAQDQFEDYGQAKLLLAKARGTYDVLDPFLVEAEGQKTSDAIYASFDAGLQSLGNPGLFGIGNEASDPDRFKSETEKIMKQLEKSFPLPEQTDDKSHLTEENLDLLQKDQEGDNSFWMWFTIGLAAIFVALVLFRRRKQQSS